MLSEMHVIFERVFPLPHTYTKDFWKGLQKKSENNYTTELLCSFREITQLFQGWRDKNYQNIIKRILHLLSAKCFFKNGLDQSHISFLQEK